MSGLCAVAFGWTLWVCLLAGCSFTAAQNESEMNNCSTNANQLIAASKVDEFCENLPWSSQEVASVQLSLMKLRDILHKQQLKDCQGAEPNECPVANVPENGGLACVTVARSRYCKPLCNNGFDFAFLRRSQLYNECSEQTKYKWDSQYVGGNTLAVCNEATLQIGGAKTAYFSKNQTCLATKSSSQLHNDILSTFINELRSNNIKGEVQQTCLVCGDQ